MANFLTIFVVPLMVALIWQFVATLLMRLLGVRLPFNLFGKERKRALQLLTFSQSVWEGVLSFGIGMLICMTLFEYLNCRFGNARCPDFSMKIRFYAVLWPAIGLFVGAMHGSENRNRRVSPEPPGIGKRD